jgi:hypothetical protein
MKLWLLSRKEPGGYDTYSEFVIAAETSFKARAQASIHNDSEHRVWLDARYSICTRIAEDSKFQEPQIICASFHAG